MEIENSYISKRREDREDVSSVDILLECFQGIELPSIYGQRQGEVAAMRVYF